MKFKKYPVQIWFLDENLNQSAQCLTNKLLVKTISGCMQALITSRFYFIGIRNKKFYDYFFGKEHQVETMDRFFPEWPLKIKPKFVKYTSKEGKWTRKCKEHYDYVKSYLRILLDEYQYRFGKEHNLSKFLTWLDVDAPKLNIPEGHLKRIILPWKVINIKYRRKNIIDGYRLQFMNQFEKEPQEEFLKTKRDIPEFVIKFFGLHF